MLRSRLVAAALLLLIGGAPLEAQRPNTIDGADAAISPQGKLYRRWFWHAAPRGLNSLRGAPDAVTNALNILDAAAKRSRDQPRPALDGGWVNIGPSPILGGQVGLRRHERSVNGRVRTVAVDPDNHDHWLIGAAQGGIWETSDGGRTWKARTDDQCSLAMGAIAFGPVNPRTGRRVVYAGTGEASIVASSYGGSGLLVYGDDSSGRWHPRPLPKSGPCLPSPFVGLAFSRLLVDPVKPTRLIAAVMKPGPPDDSNPPTKGQRDRLGVIISPDGGETWKSQSKCGLEGDTAEGATDVVVNADASSSIELYAGLILTSETHGSYGIYRRTRDGCWTQIGSPKPVPETNDIPTVAIGRIEFASTPRFPNTLYVSITDRRAGRFFALRGLWRTTDAWSANPKFQRVELTGGAGGGPGDWGYCGAHPVAGVQRLNDIFEGVCHYAHTISVDPDRPDVIYAGGIGLWKATVNCDSPTCTADWKEISNITTPHAATPRLRRRGIHVDQHAMAWAGRRLIVVNDGGVWSTTDGGINWQDHNSGLSVAQFYGGAVADHDGGLFILAGAQDNGTVRWAGSAWDFVRGGDAGRPVLSSTNPVTHWGLTYASIVEGRTIQRTRDAGEEFIPADSPIPIKARDLYFPAGPLASCAPFKRNDARDVVVAAAGPTLWMSPTFFSSATSPTWKPITVGSSNYEIISRVAFAPKRCGVVAAALDTYDGNGTPVFHDLMVAPALAQTDMRRVATFRSMMSAIAFGPGADQVYVTLSGPEVFGAFRVDDALGPAREVDLQTGFPIPHTALAVVPDRTAPGMTHIWIGTDAGVLHGYCHRTTMPCQWTRHGPERGMPNVTVTDIQATPSGRVVAFTYGRGAFVFVEGDGWCRGKPDAGIGTNFGACP